MKGLAGKVVVITGGETGIGRAIALRCVAEGALVAAAGIQPDKLDEVVGLAEAAQTAGRVIGVLTDVRERAQIDALFERTVAEFGRLDAAIANAATFNPSTPLIDTDMADWHRVIAVNLTGAFETLQAAARVLLTQDEGGSLLATSSSTVGRPSLGVLPYVASKGGLQLVMRALAIELAPHNIRCNTIMPDSPARRRSITSRMYISTRQLTRRRWARWSNRKNSPAWLPLQSATRRRI